MSRPEQSIQKALFEHIDKRGVPGMFACHVPNGGRRSRVEGAIFKGLGVRAGVPDVIAFYRGEAFALELKAAKGRVDPKQADVIAKLEAAGVTVGIAYGLDQAIAFFERHGLLRGTSTFTTIGEAGFEQ